jgi:hypothetical protein
MCQGLRAESLFNFKFPVSRKWGNTFQLFLSSGVCQLHWKGRILIQRLQRTSQLQTKIYESIQFRRADMPKRVRSLYLSHLMHLLTRCYVLIIRAASNGGIDRYAQRLISTMGIARCSMGSNFQSFAGWKSSTDNVHTISILSTLPSSGDTSVILFCGYLKLIHLPKLFLCLQCCLPLILGVRTRLLELRLEAVEFLRLIWQGHQPPIG